MTTPPLYGFDVFTDATGDEIDPVVHRIVGVGLSTPSGVTVYDGEEAEIIQLVDHRLAMLPPGVLVTWQGSLLDLPLLHMRCQALDVTPGLRLRPDHRAAPPSVVRYVEHPWCARWHEHAHLELRRIYQHSPSWWRSLRQRLDPESMIPPVNALTARDPGRDADLARCLAERRWHQARKMIDRMPDDHATGGAPEQPARRANHRS